MKDDSKTGIEVQQIIQDLWAELLEVQINEESDFFEAGGDSLLVVDFIVRASESGLDIKPADVFKFPTSRQLANMLLARTDPVRADEANGMDNGARAEGEPYDTSPYSGLRVNVDETWRTHEAPYTPGAPRCLVRLSADVPGHPLFVVHWGNSAGYVWDAARAWGNGRPVYGFEAPGYRGEIRPLLGITDLAERYLIELLEREPQGPYYLVGICHCALVALEMARRLQALSREVALLAMIRTPTLDPFISLGWGLDQILDLRLESVRRRFSLTGHEDLDEIYRRMRAAGWYDDQVRPRDVPRLQLLWAALALSQHQYQPQPYDGEVLAFQDVTDAAAFARNWEPVLPRLSTIWLDLGGGESPRPFVEHPEVARLIKQKN